MRIINSKNKITLIIVFVLILLLITPFSYAISPIDFDDGQTSDFLYTGKDKETGLYYYGARYYDTDLMTFITPEKDIPNLYNPQDLNHYTYVRNNPYKYVDPSGEIPVETIVDVVFIAYGTYQFARDPSLQTFSDLGVDVGFALLPYVPNVKRFAEGAKLIDKAKDVLKGGEKTGEVGKISQKVEKSIQEGNKLHGAANPAVKESIEQGMREHRRFYQEMGEKGMITNKAIPGTRLRPDALDHSGKMIYELKPNTPTAITKGEKQAQRYQEAANKAYSDQFKSKVQTYKKLRGGNP